MERAAVRVPGPRLASHSDADRMMGLTLLMRRTGTGLCGLGTPALWIRALTDPVVRGKAAWPSGACGTQAPIGGARGTQAPIGTCDLREKTAAQPGEPGQRVIDHLRQSAVYPRSLTRVALGSGEAGVICVSSMAASRSQATGPSAERRAAGGRTPGLAGSLQRQDADHRGGGMPTAAAAGCRLMSFGRPGRWVTCQRCGETSP
jgi:hypothetical protein